MSVIQVTQDGGHPAVRPVVGGKAELRLVLVVSAAAALETRHYRRGAR